MLPMYMHLRGNVYYVRIPVPKWMQPTIKRKEITYSLKTRDIVVARKRGAKEVGKVRTLFDCVEAGNYTAEQWFKNVDRLSERLGLRPIQAAVLEAGTIEEIFDAAAQNVAIVEKWPTITPCQVTAIASTVKSKLTWKDLLNRFVELDRDHFSPKDDLRTRRKRYTPRLNAIETFEKVLPNRDVLGLSRRDIELFRQHLMDEGQKGKLKAGTQNKKLSYLRDMINKVFEVDFKGRPNPFDGVFVKVFDDGTRETFNETDIRKICEFLDAADVSTELKALNYVAMFTGAHQKELCLLTANDIVLSGPVPFIKIGPNANRHTVKHGKERHREVPLIGKALEWMQKFPNGFPTYCRSGGPDAASQAANKHLKPLTGKTFYGYRHRLADLLRNSGCEDSLQNAIMGHKTPGMNSHYGKGYRIEVKQRALIRAFSLSKKRVEL